MVIWRGVTLWVELKSGSSLSEHQKHTRDALRENGHLWALARNGDELEAALRDAGISLRATFGERVARLAEIHGHAAVKAKRARPPGEPRYTAGKAMTRRMAAKGLLT